MARDPFVLSAFTMSVPAHGNFGLWRHPEDRTSRYTSLEYWTDLARLLDDGGFDALFVADAVGQLDVHGGSARPAIERGVQTPVTDPLLAVSAMAAATEHLGFGITVSTTYEYPYLLARKFSTLDHLTRGRIAWNVVTSLLDSAARNIIGADRQIPHDQRYDIAQEFIEVTYKLWEGSWEDDAVIRDTQRGIYTDPDKVHPIDHHGRWFTVPGAHLTEPSPQRTPVIFQAGTSERGKDFAAHNAEVVFVSDPRPEVLRDQIGDIRERAVRAGRRPESIRFITSIVVVTDSTDEAAADKAADYASRLDIEGNLVLFSALSGVDWAGHDIDRPLAGFDTDASRSVLLAVPDAERRRSVTLRDYVGGLNGFGGPAFVGGPGTVADGLEAYAETTGVDGFNLAYVVTPGSYADFAEHVIPELRRRGRVRPRRPGRTLREALTGAGSPLLPADHPAAAHRHGN